MATIADLVTNFYTNERPSGFGNLLGENQLLAQCLAATKFYAGYADLESHLALPITDPPTPYPAIDETTDLSLSEWAIIRPLFMLYVERENSLQLESTRGMGVDVFGRSSSEVAGEITQYETEMHHKAFCQEIITV